MTDLSSEEYPYNAFIDDGVYLWRHDGNDQWYPHVEQQDQAKTLEEIRAQAREDGVDEPHRIVVIPLTEYLGLHNGMDYLAKMAVSSTQHTLTLTHCCDDLHMRPAHGHRPTPVCSCGWRGEEHNSTLMAKREWSEHRYAPEVDPE